MRRADRISSAADRGGALQGAGLKGKIEMAPVFHRLSFLIRAAFPDLLSGTAPSPGALHAPARQSFNAFIRTLTGNL